MTDEIVREGAHRMLAEALPAEVDACIAAFTHMRVLGGAGLDSPQLLDAGRGGRYRL